MKPLDDFAWRRVEKGQRDNYWRPCRANYKKEHYAANKQRYVANAARRKRRVARDNIARLLAFFETHACVDCGEDDPLVLEFDHIGDKNFTIARALRDRSWSEVAIEIELCEVVCANCHRRRTARRGEWIRARASEMLTSGDYVAARQRALRLISARAPRV